MKLLNLALANIKNAKSATVSLFLMIFIASLLLNIGLAISQQTSTFYDNKFEQLTEPHINIIYRDANDSVEYTDFLNNHPEVTKVEKENVIWMSMNSVKVRYGDSDMSTELIIFNRETEREFGQIQIIESLADEQSGDIYLPYLFKLEGGYKLGDSFTISYMNDNYSYRVAGFFETAMLSRPGGLKFFLPDADYKQLYEQIGEVEGGVQLAVQLANKEKTIELLNAFNLQFPDLNNDASKPLFFQVDIQTVKEVLSMTINIITMILIAFAAIIVIVTLIVIQYRVSSNVTEGIVNIGVLKSIGYTSAQIISFTVIQFSIISIIASLLGVAVSYAVIPIFGTIVTSLSGMIWISKLHVIIDAVSVAVIVILVLLVTVISSLRIKGLAPVTALRGGLSTHSFKRNFFPLERATGGLQWLLACKSSMLNLKQNIMIVIIVIATTFASVFSIVLYYNIAADKTAFIHLVGAEDSNVMLQIHADRDSYSIMSEIEQMDYVTKVAALDMISLTIDNQSFYTNVTDDFSKLNNQNVYEGRFPRYDNEIAISWIVAKMLNKDIGDSVEVELPAYSKTYLITGFNQSINNSGQETHMTSEGVKHVLPHYKPSLVNVYLDGIDNITFIEQLKNKFPNDIAEPIDVDETMKSQTSMYTSAVLIVMITILIITVLVVVLILYLVIKKMILQRKKDFGIMKAIGFSTAKLMAQISFGFVPIVVIGVVIGGLLGAFYTNTVLELLFSGAGILNVSFTIHVPSIVAVCAGLIVLAYAISMLVSYGIKRVTAHGLLTE